MQTAGNIFNNRRHLKALEKLLINKIDAYNKQNSQSTGRDFARDLKNNLYSLTGWAIVMSEGGNLKSHNHEQGWLTGTFYLQVPDPSDNKNEGAIAFSHKGPNYPKGTSLFPEKIIRPKSRDLNIFPSSLFHKTLPFQGDKKRICIAFDVKKSGK